MKQMKGESNEIKLLAQSFDQITDRLKENVKSLELAQSTLHSIMAKVGHGITSMQNIDSFLELIIETVTDAIKGRVGLLMLIENDEDELCIKAVKGVEYDTTDPIRIKISVICKDPPSLIWEYKTQRRIIGRMDIRRKRTVNFLRIDVFSIEPTMRFFLSFSVIMS